MGLENITVITVNYHSAHVLGDMLKSLPACVKVIIVDNSSVDNLQVYNTNNNIKIIKNEKNYGFGAACNIGANAANTEYLFFLNPDTIVEKGCIETLILSSQKYSNASAFNPRICNRKNKPCFKKNIRFMKKDKNLKRCRPKVDADINVLSGAAIFIKRDVFLSVGGFDKHIFLYHEDVDLSIRLKEGIGNLMFIHDSTIKHLEGRSTKRTPELASFKSFHLARSRIYTMKKHRILFPFLSTFGIGLASLLSPLVIFSRRKRHKSVAFMKGILSCYRDGGIHNSNLNNFLSNNSHFD
jgi:GT2 family glycosyltransferase